MLKPDHHTTTPLCSPPPRTARVVDPLCAILLALGGAAFAGYRYGRDDQVQYLAHLTALRDPAPFANDPYIRAFDSLGSVFWRPFSWIDHPTLDPILALLVTLAIGTTLALILVRLTRAAGAKGALALTTPAILLTPKEENYFGLVTLVDIELTATYAVLPLCAGSIYAWTTNRVWWSLVLALVAVPIHAQTGAALLALWCVSTLTQRPRDRWIALIIGTSGLVGAWSARSVAPVSPENLGAYESIGRALYAPLIDILSVPWRSWVALAIVLSFGLATIPSVFGSPNNPRTTSARTRLGILALGSLVYPILGAILSVIDPSEPLLWRLMIPRSLMITQLVALIFAGLWISDRFDEDRPVVASIALTSLALWPLTHISHSASALLAVLVLLTILHGSGPRQPTPLPVAPRVPALVSVSILMSVSIQSFVARAHPWTRADQPSAWLEIQTRARDHTPRSAVFVTPPYLSGWRVGSQRTTFGQLRDGGLFFYAGDPALEWWDRMTLLGMHTPRRWSVRAPHSSDSPLHTKLIDSYHDALRENGDRIIETSGAQYIVVDPIRSAGIPGTPIITIDRYQIRAITTPDNPAPG